MSSRYKALLTSAQQIFGDDVLPTLEVDAHGLLMDCTFVGLPGNISFFRDPGNLNGFDAKLKVALDLAVGQGYAKVRSGFTPVDFDYRRLADLAKIEYLEPDQTFTKIDDKKIGLSPDGAGLDERTIFTFTIRFEPNDPHFPPDRYGGDFNRAIRSASTFGNAVVLIRGHSDPTKTLVELIRAGMAQGIIQRSGQSGNYRYYLKTENGSQPLDLTQTRTIAKLIASDQFDGTQSSPRETMQAALKLSQARAEAVKEAIGRFAELQGVNLDMSQMQPVGAGILEPLIPKPRNLLEARQNMRVEFRIVKVPAEAISESEFDF